MQGDDKASSNAGDPENSSHDHGKKCPLRGWKANEAELGSLEGGKGWLHGITVGKQLQTSKLMHRHLLVLQKTLICERFGKSVNLNLAHR